LGLLRQRLRSSKASTGPSERGVDHPDIRFPVEEPEVLHMLVGDPLEALQLGAVDF
jgi:hypothetical protein